MVLLPGLVPADVDGMRTALVTTMKHHTPDVNDTVPDGYRVTDADRASVEAGGRGFDDLKERLAPYVHVRPNGEHYPA